MRFAIGQAVTPSSNSFWLKVKISSFVVCWSSRLILKLDELCLDEQW